MKNEDSKSEPMVAVKENNKEQVVPASDASKEIIRISGKRPFDLSPDELIIEEKRIVYKKNYFPWTSVVSTFLIDKMLECELTHSLLYSNLHIKANDVTPVDIRMSWLDHSEAKKVKEIIDGMRLANTKSIEIKERNSPQVAKTLEILGSTS
ncbi:MAG: hypothetical protein U0525_02625 [Patescibacteria group bacterium]